MNDTAPDTPPASTPFVARPPRLFLHTLCEVEIPREDTPTRHPATAVGTHVPPKTPTDATTTEAGVLLVLSISGGIVGIPRARMDTFVPDAPLRIKVRGQDDLSLPAVVVRGGVDEPLWGLHVPFRFVDLTHEMTTRLDAFLRNQSRETSNPFLSASRRSLRKKRRRRLRLYLVAGCVALTLLLVYHALQAGFRASPTPSSTHAITAPAAPRPAAADMVPASERPPRTPDPFQQVLDNRNRHDVDLIRHSTYESLTPDQRAWLHRTFTAEELEQIRTLRGE